MIQVRVTNMETKHVPISATTTIFPTTTTTPSPLNTCSHITTQYQSHYRPYMISNLDISVELAQQHASCVDITIRASPHKSRDSILPTYNINASDHHTHPIHCHALHHHRTTTTITANTSDPNTEI